MSKPRTIQSTEGTRQAPVKQVLLEIIQNRTGAVRSDEIYGALVNGWVLPELRNEKRWLAVMLSELASQKFIIKTGVSLSANANANANADRAWGYSPNVVRLAMYDIAPAGAAFLAAGGGVVPKYKPKPPPLIDEDGALIPRLAWKAPRCKWRKGRPAAAHMYMGARS